MMNRSAQISWARSLACRGLEGRSSPGFEDELFMLKCGGCLHSRNSVDHDGGFFNPQNADATLSSATLCRQPFGSMYHPKPSVAVFFPVASSRASKVLNSVLHPFSGVNIEGLPPSRLVLEPVQSLFRNRLRHFRKLCHPSEGA